MCKKGDMDHNKATIIETDPTFFKYMCFECGDVWIKFKERQVRTTKKKKKR